MKNNLDPMAMTAISKKAKVYAEFNPYFSNDTQVEIQAVEQIPVYHKKLKGTRILGELLKDKKYSKWRKKRIIKDLLKFWEEEFKTRMEAQKQELIDNTTKNAKKKIKRIGSLFITLSGFICILAILLSARISYIENISFLKGFFVKFNSLMENSQNHNILIGLIYLSLITCLYLIVLKTYFEVFRKVSSNANKFIDEEFIKIEKSFNLQQKDLRAHLYRFMRSSIFKGKFKLKKLFDPQVVIKKLEDYGKYIETKVTGFRKYYYLFVLLGFILEIGVLALTGYIGYLYNGIKL